MADLATLTTWRDGLLSARAQGVLTVEYEGRRLTYKSDTEMAAALADLEARITATQGSRVKQISVSSTKGLS